MKLISSILVLSILASSAAYAEDESWGYTCTNDEVIGFTPKNLKIIGKSNDSTSVIDEKSVKLDRKNKTASVWITYIAFPKMTDMWAQQISQDYANLGYIKQLKVFDLSTSRVKLLTSTLYQCSGTNITSMKGNNTWDYVVQDSIDDTMLKYLKSL